MTPQFWLSLVMGVVGIVGIFIAGRGRWQGWLIGFLVQPVWVAFFIVTEAWGGLALPLGYGWVYARNLLAWRRQGAPTSIETTESRTQDYEAIVRSRNDGYDVVNQAVMDLGAGLGVRRITEDEWPEAKFFVRYDVPGGTFQSPTMHGGSLEWMGLRALVKEALRRLGEVNTMALTKHGHGRLIKEDDLIKTASSEDEAEVLAALAEENEEADR